MTYTNHMIYPPDPSDAAHWPHKAGCHCIYCQMAHHAAEQPCSICERPLGYGNQVYMTDSGAFHKECFETRVTGWLVEAEREVNEVGGLPPATDGPMKRGPKRAELVARIETIRAWLAGSCTNEELNKAVHAAKLLPTGARLSW
jgi:hypothetical protein